MVTNGLIPTGWQRRRRAGVVLAVLAVTMIAAACGTDRGRNSGSATSGGSAKEAAGGVAAAGPSAAASAAGASAAGAAAGQPTSGSTAAPSALLGRDIVRTATMNLTVRNVGRADDALTATTVQVGGRVDGDDRRSGQDPTATLVLRVPPDKLSQVMSSAHGLGTETARTVTGKDVTSSAADLQGRIAALTTSQDRLLALMSHSGSLAALQSLESQLTNRQEQLQSLRDQQRALSDQITLASLTVTFTSRPVAVAARPAHHTVFSAALSGGWHSFVVVWHAVALAIGYSLPYLVTLAVLAAGWFARRRIWNLVHRRSGPSTGSVGDAG